MSGKPEKSPYPMSGYPGQGYPTAGFPTQQYSTQPPGYYSSVTYGQPAPGVSVMHSAQSYSSPGAYAAPPAPQGPPPPYSYAPSPPMQHYPQQSQGVYIANNAFDSGARFDGIAQPNIPPPPPGVAPNVAQMAMYGGQPVIATQRRSDFFSGGDGGGWTLGGL